MDLLRVEEELLVREFKERGFNPVILSSKKPLRIPEPSLEGVVVLVRNISATNSIYVSALVEGSGGVSINSSRSLLVGHDKLLTYTLLARYGVRIPKTIVALDGVELEEVVGSVEYPAIVKPPVGSWGRLVSIAKSPEALRQIYSHRVEMEAPQFRVHIIQKPATLGRDIRCLTIKGEVVACMERRGPPGDWRSNAALGGEAVHFKPTGEIVELAVKASEAIGAEIAGVDIVYDSEGFYVNEVNVVPEFKALMKASGINIAKHIADYVVSIARK